MASTKDLKKRIGTVKSTQQTTRAMKMVSAAKLRRAQEAIQNHRPYARKMGDMIRVAAALGEGDAENPFLSKGLPPDSGTPQKTLLLVLVTSDRSLCGGFNSNVIKNAIRYVAANQSRYQKIEMSFVGRKSYEYFKTKAYKLNEYYSELGGKVTYDKAQRLADSLVSKFISGEFTEIKFVYNEFKNAASQLVRVEDFLPLIEAPSNDGRVAAPESDPRTNYIAKPSLVEVLNALLKKNFAVQAFRIMLESQASEHGARMSAMENATKNAGEMMRKLTLQYNKQRQAGITKELLEIISGSESQKGQN